jgi:hypothetical protein
MARAGINPTAVDTDDDGMPDDWETAKGLNPKVAMRAGEA